MAPVLGICNGFQVLLEAGLLPGAMLPNAGRQFRCEWVSVRVESNRSGFLGETSAGDVLRLPIAHGEGRYFAPDSVLRQLEEHDQIALRYCDPAGTVTDSANPNGSLRGSLGSPIVRAMFWDLCRTLSGLVRPSLEALTAWRYSSHYFRR